MPKPLIIHATLTGNDRHPGTTPAMAVRTLTRAQALVRAARKQQPKRAVEVWLHGGQWLLSAPLRFMAADGGSAQAAVVWRSAPGTRAEISGAQVVTGWREATLNGRTCWQAELPDVAAGRWAFTQIFVGGERRHWSRWPREGFSNFAGLDGQSDSGFTWNHGPQRAEYRAGDIDADWHRRDEVRLVAYQLWFETHHRIAEVDPARKLVHFRAKSIGSLIDETGLLARYACFNVREALVEPGTWHLDAKAGVLTYLPLAREIMNVVPVLAPRLQQVIEVVGTAKAPVCHLRFEHLTFRHTDFERPLERTGAVQAAFDVPGAVRFTWAEHCVMYACEVSQVGGYAVQIAGGCHGSVVAACRLHDLGAGGVRVDHEQLEVHDAAVGKQQILLRPEHQAATIIDNTVRDTGIRYPSSTGIFVANAGHCRILHNDLHEIPYTGISVGWTWGYTPTRTVANRIEDNHIHHVNHRRLLSDNGCIYTLGRHPGSVIAGNHIHDVGCYGYGGWGIYPDEGSSEFVIAENLVYRTSHAGFHMHYGAAIQVRDNVFADAGEAQFKLSRSESHRSLTFTGNVVQATAGTWESAFTLPPALVLWRDTIAYDVRQDPVPPKLFAELQAAGQHRGLRQCDPALVDAGGGDARPFAHGPARRLAKAMMRAMGAGVRPLPRLPERFADYPLPIAKPYQIIETRLEPQGLPVALESGGYRVPFRVTFTNPGLVAAPVRVRLVPGAKSRLVGTPLVSGRLAPGATLVRDVEIVVAANQPQAQLETKPLAAPAMPHLVFVRLAVGLHRYSLAHLASPAALDALPPEVTRFGLQGPVCATFRLAHAGDDVWLLADVVDQRIHHSASFWLGSCLELYVASATTAAAAPTRAHLAFLPPYGAVAAKTQIIRNRGSLVAEAVSNVEYTPRSDGYQLRARIPKAVLGILAEERSFRLEVAVTAARGPDSAADRSAWRGCTHAYSDAEGMALVELA